MSKMEQTRDVNQNPPDVHEMTSLPPVTTQGARTDRASRSEESNYLEGVPGDYDIENHSAHQVGQNHSSTPDDDILHEQRKNSYAEKMIAAGWCCHKVEYLKTSFDIDTFHSLSTFEVSNTRIKDHTRCKLEQSCVAFNVDVDTYETKHVHEACQCQMVAVPYDQLVQIIRGGDVPLASIEVELGQDGTEIVRLKLQKRRTASAYVAVSHVWADGLGNSKGNSFPTCQLKKLRSILDDLEPEFALDEWSPGYRRPNYKERLFWLDTLCIPLRTMHPKLFARSLDAMASIYGLAGICVILDAELMDLTSPDAEVFFPRLILSTWMSRSWTMQEGILANKCAFRLAHNTVVFRIVKEYLMFDVVGRERSDSRVKYKAFATSQKRLKYVSSLLSYYCRKLFGRMSHAHSFYFHLSKQQSRFDSALRFHLMDHFLKISNHQPIQGIVITWNELRFRSTTKSEDCLPIMLNVLGYHCRQILDLSSELQVPALFLKSRRIPFDILSNPIADGLDKMRWLPTRLTRTSLRKEPYLSVNSTSSAITLNMRSFHDKGYQMFLIDNFKLSDQEVSVMQDNSEISYSISDISLQLDADSQLRSPATVCVIFDENSSKGAIFVITGSKFLKGFARILSRILYTGYAWRLPRRLALSLLRSLSAQHRAHSIGSEDYETLSLTLNYISSVKVKRVPVPLLSPGMNCDTDVYSAKDLLPNPFLRMEICHGYSPQLMKPSLHPRNTLAELVIMIYHYSMVILVAGAIEVAYALAYISVPNYDQIIVFLFAFLYVLFSVGLATFIHVWILDPCIGIAYNYIGRKLFPTFSILRWLETRSYQLDRS